MSSTTAGDSRAGTVARAGALTSGVGLIYAVTPVLSACSILYELLAAQTLAMLCANTVVWYSLTIGVFLCAMGVGSFLSRGIARDGSPWQALFRVEVALTAIGLAIVPLLHFAHMANAYATVNEPKLWADLLFFGTAFCLTSGIGVLTGIELPLLMRAARRATQDDAAANTVLGLDYFGSLIGAFLFPIVLLPNLRLLGIGGLIAVVNLIVAGVLVATLLAEERRAGFVKYALLGLLAAGLGTFLFSVDRVQQYFLRKYYYYYETAAAGDLLAPMPELPEVFRERSPYQRIDLMKDVNPDLGALLIRAYSDKHESVPEDFPWHHILFLNGDFQTNTTYEEIYHEWFAHVPIVTRGEIPRRVLVMGGGDGYLIRELVKYDAVESIVHVDIDPVLPRLARTHPVIRAANRGAFEDPRVETRIMDGYQYVRRTDDRYDAIYIDFPVAADYDLAKLYSREFFTFVRRCVAPGGFAIFDSTGTSWLTIPDAGGRQVLLPENDWYRYYPTLRKAGWPEIVPFLTTLEVENDRAFELIREVEGLEFDVSPEFAMAWNAAQTEEEREALVRAVLRRYVLDNMLLLQQGFIMLSNEPGLLAEPQWRDPGVTLHVLNEDRYRRAFEVEFPKPLVIDEDLVNSIMRPTFPSTPTFTIRRPY